MKEKLSALGLTAKKHHWISDDLRKQILGGRLTERIPGQRILADRYGVNFLTIRKAVATLVSEGILMRQPGAGTFITRLKRERTHNIAAVLGGLAYGFGGQHSSLIHGIQQESAKHHHDLIFRPHYGDPELELLAIQDIIEREKVDGFLIWPSSRDVSRSIELLQKRKVPFVVVVRDDPSFRNKVNYVVNDHIKGGCLATAHLLKLGHRSIGYVARTDIPASGDYFEELRWQGFLKAHKERGIVPGPRLKADWLDANTRPKRLEEKFLRQIKGLTALFCVNDRMALHVLRLPQFSRLRIPDDLSVVGYDDVEPAELFNLTTVHQPMAEIGATAVQLLIEAMESDQGSTEYRVLSPRLIIRGTTASPAKS